VTAPASPMTTESAGVWWRACRFPGIVPIGGVAPPSPQHRSYHDAAFRRCQRFDGSDRHRESSDKKVGPVFVVVDGPGAWTTGTHRTHK